MSNEMLGKFIIGALALFGGLIVAFLIINKFTNKKNTKFVASLVDGTKTKSFSKEIMYQKIYLILGIYFIEKVIQLIIIIKRRENLLNTMIEI